jgi:hypothetical protein
MVKRKSRANKRTVGSSKEKIILISAIVFIIGSLVAITSYVLVPRVMNESRKSRILETYAKINVSDEYGLRSQNVFGEKRVYEWDKSRTYSSSEDFIRGKNVDDTVKDLQTRVTKAGFKLIDHPYPFQWQYKSDDGIYVRFDVLSKPRTEYFQNQSIMKEAASSSSDQIDPNTGPSLVTLKVNLDDNNE